MIFMKTKKQKVHKDIQPELAKAMRTVRQQFIKQPLTYLSFMPNVECVSEAGCIIAHVACRLGQPYYSIIDFAYSFDKSEIAIRAMFMESVHNKDAKWAVARIDQFLRTNT